MPPYTSRIIHQNESESEPGNSPSAVDLARLADILLANGDGAAAFDIFHCQEPGRGFVGRCLGCSREFYHPFSCGLRVCAKCAARRAASLSDDIQPVLKRAILNAPFPYPLKHIVLTTGINLADKAKYDPETDLLDLDCLKSFGSEIERLQTSIRLMIQDRFKGVDGIGGFIAYEFGSAGFNLHFHVLAIVPPWPQEDLSETWERVSGGLGRVVHIEAITGTLEERLERVSYITKEVSAAVTGKEARRDETENTRRMADYIVDHGIEPLLAAMHFTLKGHRRFRSFGSCYGKIQEEEKSKNCPECGGFIWWRTELEWMAEQLGPQALSLKRGNKFADPTEPSTGDLKQMGLFDG